ncbi:amidohydrolase [Flavobacterium faecale]|uniref:Omega-amidase YafV n=1 Tax=Flavobacterium faecale TaxID=1355330 RepID=A0A2S1LBF5_9FLAO|nr:amidohydrolase [Flavobacterium faecale]AWG21085.1 amidohydrolase [Flavobacterium faecale]
MKIALVQAALEWENPNANRMMFETKIKEIDLAVELIILPEMFSTGFTMNPATQAETMTGDTVKWMQDLAKSRNCAFTGSLVIQENNNFYNRMLFVFPTGEIETYDKRHLFTLAGEEKVYTAGSQKVIVDYLGWKICLQVCYDLRFPVFSRNTENYDLLLYVANWPEKRVLAWDSLLRARAIENLCYVAAVNRVGQDANDLHYNGHSQVVAPLGDYVVSPQTDEAVFVTDLDLQLVQSTRQQFNFLNDGDAFEIKF